MESARWAFTGGGGASQDGCHRAQFLSVFVCVFLLQAASNACLRSQHPSRAESGKLTSRCCRGGATQHLFIVREKERKEGRKERTLDVQVFPSQEM